MKIFCIGRNYASHAREMKSEIPDEPVVFMKPQTALIKNDMPFDKPSFSNHIEYEAELVIRICRNGKNIPLKRAGNYYDRITLGIDFTARDIQQKFKEKGLPWEKAKSFDHSAPVGRFIPLSSIKDLGDLDFSLTRNGEKAQEGNTGSMLFSFDQLVSHLSRFFTLHIGDLIFTGTPEGVGKVNDNDVLEGYIGKDKVLNCIVK